MTKYGLKKHHKNTQKLMNLCIHSFIKAVKIPKIHKTYPLGYDAQIATWHESRRGIKSRHTQKRERVRPRVSRSEAAGFLYLQNFRTYFVIKLANFRTYSIFRTFMCVEKIVTMSRKSLLRRENRWYCRFSRTGNTAS